MAQGYRKSDLDRRDPRNVRRITPLHEARPIPSIAYILPIVVLVVVLIITLVYWSSHDPFDVYEDPESPSSDAGARSPGG